MADRTLVLQVIRELGRRARSEQLDELAHPTEIEAKFAEKLGEAQEHADIGAGRSGSVALARALPTIIDAQRTFNDAIIDVLHQLDHLARWQDERIRVLEQDLEALRSEHRPRDE